MNFLYSIVVAAYEYEEAFWGGKLEFIVSALNRLPWDYGTHHIVVRCWALIFEKGSYHNPTHTIHVKQHHVSLAIYHSYILVS